MTKLINSGIVFLNIMNRRCTHFVIKFKVIFNYPLTLPKNRLFLGLLILLTLSVFPSCLKTEEVPEVSLPPTPVLSVQTTWAVIRSSHLRLREKPSTDSRAIATLWKGSVLEIISKDPRKDIVENEDNFWYRINFDGLSGWIFGSHIELFETKSAADRASRELR